MHEPRQKGKIVAVKGSERHAVYGAPEFVDMDRGLLTLKKVIRELIKGVKFLILQMDIKVRHLIWERLSTEVRKDFSSSSC